MTDQSHLEITERNGFLCGPVRTPDNRVLARAMQSSGTSQQRAAINIHNDETAQKLGFRGGTIAGSTHMDQFVPVLVRAFGPQWFETGSLSLAFKNATISGDPVIAMVAPVADAPDVQVAARMEQPDGTIVAEGTASSGRSADAAHLQAIDLRATAGDELRLLASIRAGHRLTHDATVDGRLTEARIEAGAMTEPLDWYVGASPWGGPVAPPSSMVQLLRNRPGDFGPEIANAVGLFGAIELRHHNGPVLIGERYHVDGEVVAVGSSPKTEYVWYDTRALDDSGRLVASMRMQLRWMKASSPLYADEP
jgi:hypothetical protein